MAIKMARTTNLPLGLAIGFCGVVIFGGTLPATIFALEVYDPIFIAVFRSTIAGLLALFALLITGRKSLFAELSTTLPAGFMVTFAFPAFSSLAMQTVSPGDGGVVLGILPLSTALFAVLLNKERPSLLFWFWALLGSIIVLWFVLGKSDHLSINALPIGYLWLLIAAILTSIGYVIMAKMAAHMAGWEVICRVLVAWLPINALASFFLWKDAYWTIKLLPALGLGYHAVFSMFLGFFAWNAGLAIGGISRVGQVQLLQVFATVGLSALLLGETITLRTLLFALAVAACVWFGRKAK